MKSAARVLIGFFIAPLAVPVISFISLVLAFREDPCNGANIFTCVIIGVASYIFCLVVGIPVHVVLKTKEMYRLKNYFLSGLFGGFLSLLPVFSLLPGALKD